MTSVLISQGALIATICGFILLWLWVAFLMAWRVAR